jgi:hypothetical protein
LLLALSLLVPPAKLRDSLADDGPSDFGSSFDPFSAEEHFGKVAFVPCPH